MDSSLQKVVGIEVSKYDGKVKDKVTLQNWQFLEVITIQFLKVLLIFIEGYTVYYLHGCIEAAEVLDLSSKDEISKLSKGQEDNEEHHCKTSQVLGTASQGG